ncbi:iron-containing alcohol dehydrogenase [Caballeronia temeraria]|uniref:Iron-containing alcohol dehydrogenase n=1 Tax=Caballeronia temeraria TaxID=1777137 RepID=A0A158AHG9_9BURK|nr:maleylacetate reductase [Caballeronia temeraria]SAK57066.1 iron-containing alcohol dehydrogenase [Caballeronia temeraria]
MRSFVHETRPARVVFGNGSRQFLPRELDLLGIRRAVVITTPEQVGLGQQIAEILQGRCVGVLNRAVMHVPIDVARAAIETARQLGADGCVAAGGGSTIGLAKAIALESSLPILALPTTYAGSEMTPLYGITDNGEKKTGRDWRVMPRSVIYDPELTRSLPVQLSMTSGMNAIAHAAEALYGTDANPIYDLMAEEGIRALGAALPRLHERPGDHDARSDALYGAWLCGTVLGNVQMGLHHKLCHTLGGSFNLPHAEVHTVILPYALAYNASSAPHAMTRIARALHGEDAVRALRALGRSLGVPRSLRELGMPHDGLDRVADLIVEKPYPNPRPIERVAIRALLERAFAGAEPD